VILITTKRPAVEFDVEQRAFETVTLEAETVEEARYEESPEYSAVMLALPFVAGVHGHVAVPDETVTAVHPEIEVPPFLKWTVPVAPEVTVAVML
jgi:hypothetical protein